MKCRLVLFLLLLSAPSAGLGDFLRRILAPALDVMEEALGAGVAATLKETYGVEENHPELVQWAQAIFERVANQGQRASNFRLTVVPQNFINAFAVPGGHIFVTTGLLKKVSSDDELAAVLGHEIGHIDARHSMNSMEHQVLWQLIAREMKKRDQKELATAIQIFAVFKGLRYSRQNEQEADLYGARYAAQAGYNPVGMQSFLEILSQEKDGDPHGLGVALMSHPPTPRRVEYARNYQNQFSPEVLSRPLQRTRPGVFNPKMATGSQVRSTAVLSASRVETAPEIIASFDFSSSSEWPGVAHGFSLHGDIGLFGLEEKKGKTVQRIQTIGREKTISLKTQEIELRHSGEYVVRQGLDADLLEGKAFLRFRLENPSQILLEEAMVLSEPGAGLELRFRMKTPSGRLKLEFGLLDARGKAFFEGPVVEYQGF